MLQRSCIYREHLELQRALESLHRAMNPLSERNLQLIQQFADHCQSEGLTQLRIAKYLRHLKKLGEWLGKDFDAAEIHDIRKLVAKLESNPDYTPWTKHDYKVALKRFYSWLRGAPNPPEVSWFKLTLKPHQQMLPDQLLTEDDIRKLVDAALNPRDKAFIITLYESGARIGELGAMRIRDLEFHQEYAKLTLTGKTGTRKLIVVAALPYLIEWLRYHPLKEDPDAPLWVKLEGEPESLRYPSLAKILKAAASRAKLRKPIHPHLFRHSRATFLASRLTESQMSAVFGWKQGSRMPSIYVHLSGRDTDEALLGIYGLKKSQQQAPKLAPKLCPRCDQSNPFDARFCSKCGLALDMTAALDLEKIRTQADQLVKLLFEDPVISERVIEIFSKIKSSLKT